MADDPEVNKLDLDVPPYVLEAMREEHERFKSEQHQFGPHIVSNDTYKPRLRAAMEQAIRKQELKASE